MIARKGITYVANNIVGNVDTQPEYTTGARLSVNGQCAPAGKRTGDYLLGDSLDDKNFIEIENIMSVEPGKVVVPVIPFAVPASRVPWRSFFAPTVAPSMIPMTPSYTTRTPFITMVLPFTITISIVTAAGATIMIRACGYYSCEHMRDCKDTKMHTGITVRAVRK